MLHAAPPVSRRLQSVPRRKARAVCPSLYFPGGSVEYHEAGADYFAKRQLRKHARVWSLWALGVGAVISGHFSGWNFGLVAGGFGGLFFAAIIIGVMYVCL